MKPPEFYVEPGDYNLNIDLSMDSSCVKIVEVEALHYYGFKRAIHFQEREGGILVQFRKMEEGDFGIHVNGKHCFTIHVAKMWHARGPFHAGDIHASMEREG